MNKRTASDLYADKLLVLRYASMMSEDSNLDPSLAADIAKDCFDADPDGFRIQMNRILSSPASVEMGGINSNGYSEVRNKKKDKKQKKQKGSSDQEVDEDIDQRKESFKRERTHAENVALIANKLREHGVVDHFTNKLGGRRRLDSINVMLNRFGDFICFAYQELRGCAFKEKKLFSFIEVLCKEGYHVLDGWSEHVSKTKAAATVRNHLGDIKSVLIWFFCSSKIPKDKGLWCRISMNDMFSQVFQAINSFLISYYLLSLFLFHFQRKWYIFFC
jgi:hypothetical protein